MQRSCTPGPQTRSEGEGHDSQQAAFLLAAACSFLFQIFVDLPFLSPDSNVRPRNGEAYNTVSWLGQDAKDNHLKTTL